MPIDATDTRINTVEAVIELAASGLDAVTIEAVVRVSGTTNGSIYHHFGNRDGLLSAAIDRVFADAMAAAAPALDERPATDAIHDFVRRYVDWVVEHRSEATILYGAPLRVQSDGVSPAKVEAFAPIVAWLFDRMTRGEVRAMDPLALDPVAFGPVHEMCRRWLAHPAIDLIGTAETLGDAVANILVAI